MNFGTSGEIWQFKTKFLEKNYIFYYNYCNKQGEKAKRFFTISVNVPSPQTVLGTRYYPQSRHAWSVHFFHSARKTSQPCLETMAMKRPSKLHLKSIQALDLDQIVANLERTVLETEKKVERIISRGPTPRNLKTNYQKNVPDANGRRIEDIRKTLRGARRPSTCCCVGNVA